MNGTLSTRTNAAVNNNDNTAGDGNQLGASANNDTSTGAAHACWPTPAAGPNNKSDIETPSELGAQCNRTAPLESNHLANEIGANCAPPETTDRAAGNGLPTHARGRSPLIGDLAVGRGRAGDMNDLIDDADDLTACNAHLERKLEFNDDPIETQPIVANSPAPAEAHQRRQQRDSLGALSLISSEKRAGRVGGLVVRRFKHFEASALSSAPAPDVKIGQRVAYREYYGNEFGTIRWIGRVPQISPDWTVGVEFDNAIGEGDGSLNGRRYFIAKDCFAKFLPLASVALVDQHVGRPEPGTMISVMSASVRPGQMISIQRVSTVHVQHCFLNAPHRRPGAEFLAVNTRLHCQCPNCGPCAHVVKPPRTQRLMTTPKNATHMCQFSTYTCCGMESSDEALCTYTGNKISSLPPPPLALGPLPPIGGSWIEGSGYLSQLQAEQRKLMPEEYRLGAAPEDTAQTLRRGSSGRRRRLHQQPLGSGSSNNNNDNYTSNNNRLVREDALAGGASPLYANLALGALAGGASGHQYGAGHRDEFAVPAAEIAAAGTAFDMQSAARGKNRAQLDEKQQQPPCCPSPSSSAFGGARDAPDLIQPRDLHGGHDLHVVAPSDGWRQQAADCGQPSAAANADCVVRVQHRDSIENRYLFPTDDIIDSALEADLEALSQARYGRVGRGSRARSSVSDCSSRDSFWRRRRRLRRRKRARASSADPPPTGAAAAPTPRSPNAPFNDDLNLNGYDDDLVDLDNLNDDADEWDGLEPRAHTHHRCRRRHLRRGRFRPGHLNQPSHRSAILKKLRLLVVSCLSARSASHSTLDVAACRTSGEPASGRAGRGRRCNRKPTLSRPVSSSTDTHEEDACGNRCHAFVGAASDLGPGAVQPEAVCAAPFDCSNKAPPPRQSTAFISQRWTREEISANYYMDLAAAVDRSCSTTQLAGDAVDHSPVKAAVGCVLNGGDEDQLDQDNYCNGRCDSADCKCDKFKLAHKFDYNASECGPDGGPNMAHGRAVERFASEERARNANGRRHRRQQASAHEHEISQRHISSSSDCGFSSASQNSMNLTNASLPASAASPAKLLEEEERKRLRRLYKRLASQLAADSASARLDRCPTSEEDLFKLKSALVEIHSQGCASKKCPDSALTTSEHGLRQVAATEASVPGSRGNSARNTPSGGAKSHKKAKNNNKGSLDSGACPGSLGGCATDGASDDDDQGHSARTRQSFAEPESAVSEKCLTRAFELKLTLSINPDPTQPATNGTATLRVEDTQPGQSDQPVAASE